MLLFIGCPWWRRRFQPVLLAAWAGVGSPQVQISYVCECCGMLRVGGCRNVIRDSNLFSSSFSFLFFLGGAPDVSRENRALCPIQATEDFDFPREGSFGQNFLYFLTMRNSSWRISVMPRFLYRMYCVPKKANPPPPIPRGG